VTWIQLASGTAFDLANPRECDVHLEDVVHALSLQNRFSGHTADPMSVALHSILVSEHLPLQHALAGLLHDAHEAYVVDVPRPMKALVPDYTALELRVQKVVLERFNLHPDNLAPVHEVDSMLARAEARALFPKGQELLQRWKDWQEPPECVVTLLRGLDSQDSPEKIRQAFRSVLLDLTWDEEPQLRLCSCRRPT